MDSKLNHALAQLNSTQTIEATVNRLQRTLFNKGTTELERLEHSVFNSITATPRKSPKKQPSLMQKFLRAQHRPAVTGAQILNLPKSPFGRHASYNEPPSFIGTHIVSEPNSPHVQKDINEQQRRIRLCQRQLQSAVGANAARLLQHDFDHVFIGKAGEFRCKRQAELERIYEEDAQRYRDLYKTLPTEHRLPTARRRNVAQMVKRLYPQSRRGNFSLGNTLDEQYKLIVNSE